MIQINCENGNQAIFIMKRKMDRNEIQAAEVILESGAIAKLFPLNFEEALTNTYLEDPCGVLPNALWKTLARLEDYQTSYTIENGLVTHLQIARQDSQLLCWHREISLAVMSEKATEQLDFAILHESHIENFATDQFDHTPYFRLIHTHKTLPSQENTPGFAIAPANPKSEADFISEFIDLCYPDKHPSKNNVLEWIEHPVFDPSLWLWVIDTATDTPAALGIAELDRTIQEGSLEWIQTLPEYRGHGLAKQVTLELLNRLSQNANFTTVSGEAHNDTHPDILYRKVGFEGDDIWWVLRRKE
jgi:GNAT superfamily N-acetyltransferase